MKKLLNEVAEFLIALVLGLIYMWFLLSFGWSLDDMSTAEKVAGIIYSLVMIPMYYGIKRMTGLH